MARTVGLKRNHVPPFISHLLEVTRAGGQVEPDDGIAAVVAAGKNRDPARAFRGAEAEGKAEEQHCAGGRNFLHRPFCAVKDRSSSASAEVESSRDRGRDAGCPAPPAQIPAGGFPAPGSSERLTHARAAR